MPFIDRFAVRCLAFDALREVADFAKEEESFDFSKFEKYHSYVFTNQIAKLLSQHGLSVTLSVSSLQTYQTMKTLIDYITEKQVVQSTVVPNVSLP
jgi:hypothetical protein